MYERSSEGLATRKAFLRRLLSSTFLGVSVVAASLLAGMLGFHYVERLTWIDAFLNASMLLGGMGPLEHERSVAGKLFEGLYALYSGLAVISVAAIIFAPVVHRFLHRFHRGRHEA